MGVPRRGRRSRHVTWGRAQRTVLLMPVVLAGLTCGCSSIFNQAFIGFVSTPTIDETGTVSQITIPNAPGHVPVLLINNTEFDQNLLDYLESIGVDVNIPELRPRVRVRTEVGYINENSAVFELIDGSDLIQNSIQTGEGTQEATPPADLTKNDLDNFVAICDVVFVQPGGEATSGQLSVEVFVPSFLKVIRVVEADLIVQRELVSTIPPQFVPLQPDTVDENNNIVLLQNFDIREIPVPARDVQCGSVVGFSMSGTLRVPFVQDESGQIVPGYLDTDLAAQAAHPGRFEFATSVR